MARKNEKLGTAYAYYNHGRWVVDCPREFCNNAYQVQLGELAMICNAPIDGCYFAAEVVWPVNASDIQTELAKRPVPSTRNWFPAEHPLALSAGCPHGQSVAELREETRREGKKQRRGAPGLPEKLTGRAN